MKSEWDMVIRSVNQIRYSSQAQTFSQYYFDQSPTFRPTLVSESHYILFAPFHQLCRAKPKPTM